MTTERNLLIEFSPFFSPHGVALIGASGKPGKVGRWFMDRYIEAGFKNLYPVNLKEVEILGLKAYPTVQSIPKQVDLAVILLPPNAVKGAVKDCVRKGVKGIIINSSGFSETGVAGQERQKELVKIATEGGARIIGPNCIGIYCPSGRLPFPLGAPMESGKVGIVSQSGSLADHFSIIAASMGIRFSKAISVGNESDLKVVDFLEYLGEDPETKIILSYLEGVSEGKRFYELAKSITPHKPIVVWKCGASIEGAKAAASHTGAMAGSGAIWEGAFDGSGILPVDSFEEMLDCVYAFHNCPLPKGKRIAIITGPGGPAVGTTDACIKLGLEMAQISKDTKEKLHKILSSVGISVENPIDLSMVAAISPELYGKVIKIIGEDDNIDMILAIGVGGELFYNSIIEAVQQTEKPVALNVLMPMHTIMDGYRRISGSRTVIYPDPIRAARALSRLEHYSSHLRSLSIN